MVLQDPRDNEIDSQIAQLENIKGQQRQYEKNLNARSQAMGQMPTIGMPNIRALQDKLGQMLPSYMNPSNVGDINKVSWFFWENVTFDFGTNPTLGPATTQRQSFQVDQEAGFLIMAMTRNYNSYTTAGNLGPWMVQFSDRQSSRQFQNEPTPIQMIGTLGRPTIWPTPMFLMPSAFLDCTMTTFATAQNTVGTSQHTFSFFGYRIRVQDASAVLGTIFAGG